jgi:DNA polymerase V
MNERPKMGSSMERANDRLWVTFCASSVALVAVLRHELHCRNMRRAGEKLRSHGLVAARLTAFFHTNKHKPDRPQYGGSRMVTLHPMTNDSPELIAAARRGAEKAWRDGFAYTKAGIMLDDLLREDERPRTLFEDTAKRDRLMGALDAINGKFGTWTAVTASQGFKRDWKMRSEMRSPAWTTAISQVPSVRA